MGKNEQLAHDLQAEFACNELLVRNLVSSPGVGKTELQETHRPADVTGDLATEDDAARLLEGDAPAKQILAGTMCRPEVANRILTLHLAALAMETIINSRTDLVWEALERLQEMGLAGS